jgi:hypothetical protein
LSSILVKRGLGASAIIILTQLQGFTWLKTGLSKRVVIQRLTSIKATAVAQAAAATAAACYAG